MKSNNINPALKDLKMLAGTWTMELSNASFLPDPATTIKGSASFEWFEEGDFLMMRQGMKGNGMPWATWFIGRDEDAPNYAVLYIDDRHVSRVYEMSFAKGVWKIWRNSPKFSQRFTGKLSKDGKMIKASWEKTTDGMIWEHDFDITYIRKGE